jgi:hypothetical protein
MIFGMFARLSHAAFYPRIRMIRAERLVSGVGCCGYVTTEHLQADTISEMVLLVGEVYSV